MSKLNEKTVTILEKVLDQMSENVSYDVERLDKLADVALKLITLLPQV
jgi:hypothetical protein